MAELPLLYTFRRCPYAMRARMAIAVSRIEVRQYEVSLKAKPTEMLVASPKGTVPVLVLADGRVIDESLDIMHWALAQNDPKCWLSAIDQDLIAQCDGPFKQNLDRYKYPNRYPGCDPMENRAAGAVFLAALDERLCGTRYLCGESPTLADYAIFPFVRQFANHDRMWFDALDLPRMQSWLGGLVSSDVFERIMRK